MTGAFILNSAPLLPAPSSGKEGVQPTARPKSHANHWVRRM
jgi:hypothetical protein